MKNFLLKTILLLCTLVGGTGASWATDVTGTINFGSASGSTNINTSPKTGDDSQDNEWTITTVGTTSLTPNASYAQIGSSKKPATSITFTTTLSESVNITAFSAKFGGFSGTAGTVTLKVGSTTVGTGSLNESSDVTVENSSTAEGTVLTVTVTGIAKGVKAYYISYTYSTGGGSSAVATTTTIDASGITNTNVFEGTAAGTLSASVTYGAPADAVPEASVTWSGNNNEVATINATTGKVTLVGAGIVTFTAAYAGVEDEYASSSDTYVMTVINKDPDLETIWSENFSTYNANEVPNAGTNSYACTNGSGTTKIYNENTAGGTSPELLVGKSNGTFSATIPLLYSTYGYSGDLTLTFKSNTTINVKTTTDDITVDGEANEGEGVSFTTKDTHTVTFKGVTIATENITIVFTATSSSNVRLDDIVLEGKKVALSVVATPSISPASGAVVSGTEVTMTCATDGATIYYTTDGTTPSSTSSTAYNPASKPTITSPCTIKAIAIKDGLTDSEVASADYTIAAPCATPTFSVAEGVVDKGTTVTISTTTDGATIYYTTNGDEPTTGSTEYTGAITINATQTIKAIAVKDGYANSAVASATYTIPDYATLPFEYEGNETDIPSGLTVSGTGTYIGSPKIKFDSTGDYVIIKINEAASVLSFDIKGNGFSGGTFTVQTSVDGETYTNLNAYTKLGDVTSQKFIMAANVRYIKWIYTSKSSGNVGLGNIKVQKSKGNATVTLAAACTDGEGNYYGTYSNATGFVVPSDLTVAEVGIDAEKLDVKEYETGDIVPANTGVMVSSTTSGDHNIVLSTGGKSVLDDDNRLRASGDGITAEAMGTADSGCKFFRLTMHGGTKLGFWWGADAGASFALAANKAYLAVPNTISVKGFSLFSDDETGLENVNANDNLNKTVYDLSGRRVVKPTKGLYIVNGKKYIKK